MILGTIVEMMFDEIAGALDGIDYEDFTELMSIRDLLLEYSPIEKDEIIEFFDYILF